jgi:chemotaxis protein CheC
MYCDLENIDEMKHDVLKEVANIGAGHAASSLSTLLNRSITQSVADVSLVPISKLPEILGDAGKIVVAVMLDLEGDFSGHLLTVLEYEQAEKIVSMVLSKPVRKTDRSNLHKFLAMEKSAISEIVNIMGGSYLTAISEFTNLRVVQSVPHLCIDMVGAVLSVAVTEAGKAGDIALLFKSELFNNEERLFGNLFLIPKEDSCNILLTSLGII